MHMGELTPVDSIGLNSLSAALPQMSLEGQAAAFDAVVKAPGAASALRKQMIICGVGGALVALALSAVLKKKR